jgi:hypothetical protein
VAPEAIIFAAVGALVGLLGVLFSVLNYSKQANHDLVEHINGKFLEAETIHIRESAAYREEMAVRYVTQREFFTEVARLREAISALTTLVEKISEAIPQDDRI